LPSLGSVGFSGFALASTLFDTANVLALMPSNVNQEHTEGDNEGEHQQLKAAHAGIAFRIGKHVAQVNLAGSDVEGDLYPQEQYDEKKHISGADFQRVEPLRLAALIENQQCQ
jgi:hypothetical protein